VLPTLTDLSPAGKEAVNRNCRISIRSHVIWRAPAAASGFSEQLAFRGEFRRALRQAAALRIAHFDDGPVAPGCAQVMAFWKKVNDSPGAETTRVCTHAMSSQVAASASCDL